jgi:hypothetical protein
MRVIVLQKDHKLDSQAAEEYGKRTFILESFVDPFDTEKIIKMFLRKLKQIRFNPQEDLVCLTGPSILLQLFLAVLGRRFYKIKVLMFYAPDSKYKLRTLDLGKGSHGRGH